MQETLLDEVAAGNVRKVLTLHLFGRREPRRMNATTTTATTFQRTRALLFFLMMSSITSHLAGTGEKESTTNDRI